MKTLNRWTNSLEEGVISLLLVAMVLLVFVEVIMRFVFNSGISWAQEATLHLSGWMVLFGVSYGVKVGAHIGVDVIVRLLPLGIRRVVSGTAVLFCLVYCGLFLYGAWGYLFKLWRLPIIIELEDIPVAKYIAHSILLFGFILLAIRFLQLLWLIVTGKADGFAFADEAKEAMRLSEPGHQEADGEAGR